MALDTSTISSAVTRQPTINVNCSESSGMLLKLFEAIERNNQKIDEWSCRFGVLEIKVDTLILANSEIERKIDDVTEEILPEKFDEVHIKMNAEFAQLRQNIEKVERIMQLNSEKVSSMITKIEEDNRREQENQLKEIQEQAAASNVDNHQVLQRILGAVENLCQKQHETERMVQQTWEIVEAKINDITDSLENMGRPQDRTRRENRIENHDFQLERAVPAVERDSVFSSTVKLIVRIRNMQTGQSNLIINVDAKRSDTIEEVRRKIQSRLNLPQGFLFRNNRRLFPVENSTVASADIVNGDLLEYRFNILGR